MKRILLFLILLPTYIVAQEHNGYWTGEIALPNAKLGIVVDLSGKDDSWARTIDIPTQGLRGFALSDVEVDGRGVQFRMSEIPGEPRFDGKLSVSGETIKGTFQQGSQSFSFSLQRAKRKPDPAEAGFDTIVLKEKELDFRIGSIQASFAGNLNEGGSAVEGVWRQSGRQLPITFYRIEKTSQYHAPE